MKRTTDKHRYNAQKYVDTREVDFESELQGGRVDDRFVMEDYEFDKES